MPKDWTGREMKRLAIVGLSKNAGKTTVLNHLSGAAVSRSLPAGLVSIGVDGEERDAWSGRPKPQVLVPEGAVVATAGPCLDVRAGNWEVLEELPVRSLLGQVFLARAVRPGTVKLAGICSAEEVDRVLEGFGRHGVRLALVDGAYDRKAAAHPIRSDGVILVVGASAGKTLEEVVRRTEEWVRIFSLPPCGDPLLEKAGKRAVLEGRPMGIAGEGIEPFPLSSLLVDRGKLSEAMGSRPWTALAVPGALTDRTLMLLAQCGCSFPLVLSSPTHAFFSLRTLRTFLRSGGEIRYLERPPLVGVAINPVSPEGGAFDPREMKRRMARVCRPVPVTDVIRDGFDGLHLMPWRWDGVH